MQQLLKTTIYRPQLLSEAQREQLSAELYELHCQIFTGVSYDAFRRYVVCSPAWRTWLFVQVDAAGKKVGYFALHAFRKELDDRRYVIFRMEAGTLPEHRGRSLVKLHVIVAMASVWLQHLRWQCYFFASLIHPSSYVLAARFAPQLWPRRNQPIPNEKLTLMYALAEDFNLPHVRASHPLVRVVNWVTLEHQAASTPRRPPNLDAAFFKETNPGYGQGHGLLTLAPAALPAMIIAICHICLYWCFPKIMRRLKEDVSSTTAPSSVTTLRKGSSWLRTAYDDIREYGRGTFARR